MKHELTYFDGFNASYDGLRELEKVSLKQEIEQKEAIKNQNITCKLRYDFIRLSVYLNEKGKRPDESKLWALFTDIWMKRVGNPNYKFLSEGNTKYHWTYNKAAKYKFKFNDKIYELIIAKCSFSYQYPYIITIHDPTPEVLLYLKPFLEQFQHYHVKEIEYTFDFITDDNDMVRQFLMQQTVIKWRGKGFKGNDCGTCYIGNPRMCRGKGGRIYEKKLDANLDEEVVRMEMVVKRQILKSNNIQTIEDVLTDDRSTVMKYLQFKEFNFSKFRKKMVSLSLSNEEIEKEVTVIIDRIKNGELYEVNKELLSQLRKYQSESFLKVSGFWDHFMEMIGCSSFIERDEFELDSRFLRDGLV
ncbi:MAG: hypothetical protein PHI97_04015 [Desulfobulbus sp.]|nr:hypothetical protein [Desulfobulbus sp.]